MATKPVVCLTPITPLGRVTLSMFIRGIKGEFYGYDPNPDDSAQPERQIIRNKTTFVALEEQLPPINILIIAKLSTHDELKAMIDFAERHLDQDGLIVCRESPFLGALDQMEESLNDRNAHVLYIPDFSYGGSLIQESENPFRVVVGYSKQEDLKILRKTHLKLLSRGVPFYELSLKEAEAVSFLSATYLLNKSDFAIKASLRLKEKGIEPNHVFSALGADPRIGRAYLSEEANPPNAFIEKDKWEK